MRGAVAEQNYWPGYLDALINVMLKPVFNFLLNNNSQYTASYAEGSGTQTLKLRYVFRGGDTDNQGGITASLNAFLLPTGLTLTDMAGNPAKLGTSAIRCRRDRGAGQGRQRFRQGHAHAVQGRQAGARP